MKVLSLFDGISCARLALERAGIRVEKYYASEIDKYAIAVAQKNYPDTIQVGDVNNLNYLELLDVDIVMGGSPCFPAGTLVFTDDGFLPIENIRVGMKVLTHTGAFKPVLRIGSKTTYELQQLSGGGCANLCCTPNHPFYVRDMKRRGHISKRTFGEPYWLAAENIQKQMVSSIVPRLTGEPYKDKTFWYFIGRYVGDGWYEKTKRKWRKDSYSYKVIICDSHDKFDELNALFKEMGCHYGYTKERTVYKFRICQKWLVDFVEQYVGNGAPNKRVPSILFQQPAEHKVAFLQGLLDSDGYVRNGAYKITTTSKELVYGVKFLVMELFGVLPQVHYTHRPEQTVIEGRVVNQHHTWEIKWYDGHKKQEKYAYKDGIFWSYLRRNHHWNKCVRVYNLEVADDNSYTADTMIVHNCQDLSIAKQNRQGLRGERSGLFWKYVEALEVIHPKWFLLENVASMRNEDRDAITETLKRIYPETECIMINSALLSAQQRKRYYWTNWHVEQPQDKGILLKDILESGAGVDVSQYGTNWHKTTDKSSTLMARDYKGFGNQCQTGVAVPCAMRTREDELGKFKRVEIKDDGKANSLTSVQTDSMVAEPVRIGELNGLSKAQGNRIYSVRGKSVCLNANGGGGGAKTGLYKVDLPDGDYVIRKLTPVECERLQTLTNVKKDYIIEICSDKQKNYVSAEDQSPKSQNAVGSVENDKKNEPVLSVGKSLDANTLSPTDVALPNVQVYIGESQLVIHYQNTVLLNASFAEISSQFPHLKEIECFARVFVLIDLIVGKTTSNGRADLHQNGDCLIQARNGNIVARLCGNEIMRLANCVESVMHTIQKLLSATTLYPLNIKNTEQTLTILFYYVASVIVSFIPKEIQKNYILNIHTDFGWTFGISNSQRYKAIGNGWTVDVIAHLLKGIK